MTVLFVRWIVAGLLLMVGVWSVVYNIVILLIRLNERKSHSLIPVVGGLCCALSMGLSPLAECTCGGASFPCFIDIGCLPTLIGVLVSSLRSGLPPSTAAD